MLIVQDEDMMIIIEEEDVMTIMEDEDVMTIGRRSGCDNSRREECDDNNRRRGCNGNCSIISICSKERCFIVLGLNNKLNALMPRLILKYTEYNFRRIVKNLKCYCRIDAFFLTIKNLFIVDF